MGTMMPWNAAEMKQAISAYYAVIPAGAVPNFVFGSHDVHRFATLIYAIIAVSKAGGLDTMLSFSPPSY